MRRPPSYDKIMHSCNTPGEGCQNLIASIFLQAYDDLVHTIRKGYRLALQAKREQRTMLRWKIEDEAAYYMKQANSLKGWFREVMPRWYDASPSKIIQRAYDEADADFSALMEDER